MSVCAVTLLAMCCGGAAAGGSEMPQSRSYIAWSKHGVRPLGCAQGVVVVSTTEFTFGHGGEVQGLSMENGRVLWRIDRPLGERLPMEKLRSARLRAAVWPDESALFIASSYELVRLDPRTGTVEWVSSLEPDDWAVRTVDGRLMVSNVRQTMRFDPADGRRMWRSDRTLISASSPDAVHLWAPGKYGPARKDRYELVEPRTGDHIEFYELAGGLGSVGAFRLVRDDRRLKLLEATSLQRRGWIDLEDVRHLAASSNPYGIVVTDDALAAIDVRARTVLWTRKLRVSANAFEDRAAVEIRGGDLFIGHEDTVYQLELRTGETVATYRVPGEARRFAACDRGVVVAAGKAPLGPTSQAVALDVQ